MGRSPGLENRQLSVVLITVARPRRNFTRFPILPARRGTRILTCKERVLSLVRPDTITLPRRVSNFDLLPQHSVSSKMLRIP
jgi:hypothetical protein